MIQERGERGMQSYFSDLLARERIAEFRSEADRARLAALVRDATSESRRRPRGRQRTRTQRHARRAAA
jgi:hypothetical protein